MDSIQSVDTSSSVDKKNVFVYGLNEAISELELTELFREAGPVKQVLLICDHETGRSKGFAYVEFADNDSAARAEQVFSGKSHLGSTMVVKVLVDAAKEPVATIREGTAVSVSKEDKVEPNDTVHAEIPESVRLVMKRKSALSPSHRPEGGPSAIKPPASPPSDRATVASSIQSQAPPPQRLSPSFASKTERFSPYRVPNGINGIRPTSSPSSSYYEYRQPLKQSKKPEAPQSPNGIDTRTEITGNGFSRSSSVNRFSTPGKEPRKYSPSKDGKKMSPASHTLSPSFPTHRRVYSPSSPKCPHTPRSPSSDSKRLSSELEIERRTLFVSGLPESVTANIVQIMFQDVGAVKEVRLITDPNTGKSKGFGFVEFADETSAVNGLKRSGWQLHGQDVIVTAVAPAPSPASTKTHSPAKRFPSNPSSPK